MTGFLVSLALLALVLAWVFYVLYGLKVNYDDARKTSLPLIILPFNSANLLWMIIDKKFVQLVRHIPFCSGNFTRFKWHRWEIRDRYKASAAG